MLKGVLLGVSTAMLLVSGLFLSYGIVGGFRASALTGAVIGSEGAISYALLIFVFLLIIIVTVGLMFKRKHSL
ncbi:MAG: hypothetical protein ACI83O_000652 [Patescibacteria group bacterium]|jgi:hypothetical protein